MEILQRKTFEINKLIISTITNYIDKVLRMKIFCIARRPVHISKYIYLYNILSWHLWKIHKLHSTLTQRGTWETYLQHKFQNVFEIKAKIKFGRHDKFITIGKNVLSLKSFEIALISVSPNYRKDVHRFFFFIFLKNTFISKTSNFAINISWNLFYFYLLNICYSMLFKRLHRS